MSTIHDYIETQPPDETPKAEVKKVETPFRRGTIWLSNYRRITIMAYDANGYADAIVNKTGKKIRVDTRDLKSISKF